MEEKILIIDDDLETLRLVGLMLQRQGYQIISANNGALGINLAKKEKPDLIVLDVMMPDIDGFNVTKRLRADPELNDTPILMFTAKGQVDDKVAGYEAGVDDYLIKPVHPVELVAHIKALLTRRKRATGPLPTPKKSHVIGVLSAKGGLGASTVALNLGIALQEKTKIDTICAEIIPNNGTWGIELGLADNNALNRILEKRTEDINLALVKQHLVSSNFGVSLLLSSPTFSVINQFENKDQIKKLVNVLGESTQILILDLGIGNIDLLSSLAEVCDEIIVVTEAQPIPIERTRLLIKEFDTRGISKNKHIEILVNNRTRADIQLSVAQVEDKLGVIPTIVIPPTPELAYQAVTRSLPLIRVQPENLIAKQYQRFADHVIERMKK